MIYWYLFAINIASAFFFYSDKKKAQQGKERVPEKTLHIFEYLGGVNLTVYSKPKLISK